jgi:hypothetical protein
MKNKRLLVLMVGSVITLSAGMALAENPTIKILFSDPQNLCQNANGKTQFAFNYKYLASGGVEYYSGPVNVVSHAAHINVPPPNDGVEHVYTDFEITDQGDCGKFELDYQHLGSCYLTNLIPTADRLTPHSYKITLTPQLTGNHIYGTDMYNLSCSIAVE